MKFGKYLIYAVLTAILSVFVVILTDFLQNIGFIASGASLTFVTFCSWAAYFLLGANPKAAIAGWLSMILGTIGAIIIYVVATMLGGTGMNFPYLALPLGVGVGVVIMILFGRLPAANNVAAIFLGAGLFFGTMGAPDAASKGYILVAVGELIYAAIGLAAGYLTILISNAVAKTGDGESK
jgi:hypothetical protein